MHIKQEITPERLELAKFRIIMRTKCHNICCEMCEFFESNECVWETDYECNYYSLHHQLSLEKAILINWEKQNGY